MGLGLSAFESGMPFGTKEFNFDKLATVDAAMFLADTRDCEIDLLSKLRVDELKKTARCRSVPFRSNEKKQPLLEILVRAKCPLVKYSEKHLY